LAVTQKQTYSRQQNRGVRRVSTHNPEVKLPLFIAAGWGLGTVVPSIMYNVTSFFLMPFMTDMLGIAAGTAGLIYTVSKLYDAATDPVMGVISDKTKTRWGRHRPYLVFGAIVCGASLVALFAPPGGIVGDTAVWYMLFALILYSTGYTIFNVPYLAMPAEMTQNYHERSFLMSWRVGAIQVSQVAALIASSLLLSALGGGRDAYATVGWICAGLVVIAGYTSFKMTEKAPFHEVPPGEKPKFKEQLRSVASNIPFAQLIGIKFFMLLANSFTFGSFVYFVTRVIQQPFSTLGFMTTTSTATAALSIPVWLKVSRRIGKRNALIGACAILACTALSWLLAGSDEPMFLVLLRPAFTGVAAAGILTIGQSMLPDTIEYDRRRTGLERAGVFAGIYTTAEKMAFAFGPILTGFLLQSMGYVSGTQGLATEQPESAITAIYIAMAIAPAVCLALAISVLIFYRLDEDMLKATTREGAVPAQ
jgi:GPH family glycoside/pentoside/hexuronide:cation symporter